MTTRWPNRVVVVVVEKGGSGGRGSEESWVVVGAELTDFLVG
jgi:hypothetical protein